MKIAIWHNLPSGGGKRALYHHVKGLVERGHNVESWCLSTADQDYLPLNELITEHIVPLVWTPKPPRSFPASLVSNYYTVVGQLKAIDKACRQCAEEINSGGFDLVLVNACVFFRTSPIGKYVKIRKILYLQEPLRELYEARPRLPWEALPAPAGRRGLLFLKYLKRFLNDQMWVQGLRVQVREERQNAQAFDAILVNSRFSRESMLRTYGLDSKVCYLGVDTELFHPTGVPKENFVVGLGGVALNKGIGRAITALSTIPEGKRPRLVWIGNFSAISYQQEIERLAKSLKVEVEFKVRVADKELIDLLSRATVMIYTSLLEPFGFAPLEANACGTPVVAMAEGGIRETVKDGVNGFLVDDDDPAALGNMLLKFIDNPDLAREMGQRSRQYAIENWGWDKAVDRLEKYLG